MKKKIIFVNTVEKKKKKDKLKLVLIGIDL